MTTFSKLLSDLRHHNPSHPLIFATSEGEIRAGYHITELRHSLSKGVDCGGQIETWEETRLQLMDGNGSGQMSVGKFTTILQKSISALPELAQAPLLVEFGHDNSGLALLSVGAPKAQGDMVVLPLENARAMCKPAQRPKTTRMQHDALGSSIKISAPKTPCCAPSQSHTSSGSCCA